jgi:hypothetical protein
VTPRRGRIIPFPAHRARPPVDGRTLVELHRCDQSEAVVVKSLFESHGITVVLRSRLAQSVHPFSVGDQGTIVILVPEADAARARDVLGAARWDRLHPP